MPVRSGRNSPAFAVPKTELLVPASGTLNLATFDLDKSQSSLVQQLGLTVGILARALHNDWYQSNQILCKTLNLPTPSWSVRKRKSATCWRYWSTSCLSSVRCFRSGSSRFKHSSSRSTRWRMQQFVRLSRNEASLQWSPLFSGRAVDNRVRK